ncbi:ABC transporter substrate-binding protein [Pseudomonas gingeri]|uniref:ABC transporter substrate-binding protein n=1 Tax=Pseudomonas gingeri TaxID=117681 RepID=UPI0015A33CA9|nr:ABC transporter substrate-binding protein [Pseudomonas gingeri]NWA02101.1 ABC transporter substrate-binding protein [Pseudomonas gingeri]NWA18106.1 ABC transporter substrate-binding protein [Pseudomonas gingeri]NWA56313.1 ABC transporter substrate-binding protein [Pseudomonas gingeri]NWA98891.1 ABC transporter substrate-binding protein [Pseudomonas gingeri]NWB04790.1 ABC transporter substrate-binding protein [Pseudomonas gingeri]
MLKHFSRLTLIATGLLCAGSAFAATATPGQLKVGMEITYPPFESYDAEKNVVGSDPELSHALAKHLDSKAEFIDTKFPSLIMGLNAGKFDAIISGMYITPERQTQAMTIAYAKTGAAIMVPKDSALKPTTPEDLCGLKVGLEQGTTWVAQFQKLSTDYCVPKGKGAITVSEYPSAPEVTQALLSSNIQAQVEIAGAAKMIAERTKGRVVVTTEHPIYQQTLGIFVKKGNDAVYQALLKAFEETKKSGEYAAILSKYSLEAAE